MQKNVGRYDRIARALAGLTLFLVGITSLAGFLTIAPDSVGIFLGGVVLFVGAVLTATALTQKSVLNDRLGIDTYHRALEAESVVSADSRVQ